jgi:transcriptional regulator with XRE-family HTH domain
MSPVSDDEVLDREILAAFFEAVVAALRGKLRAGVVRRLDELGLRQNELADRMGIAKSTLSEMLDAGIGELRTVVRLMMALRVEELGGLGVPPISGLAPAGWLAAMRRLCPDCGPHRRAFRRASGCPRCQALTPEDIDLLRQMILSRYRAGEKDEGRRVAQARQLAGTLSDRLGASVAGRTADDLDALARAWRAALIRCQEVIPVEE